MKKVYEQPEMEITFFSVEDIITSSSDNEAAWISQW